jgi:hypothetical protein
MVSGFSGAKAATAHYVEAKQNKPEMVSFHIGLLLILDLAT